MARLQNTAPNADKGVELQELSFIAGQSAKWYPSFGRQFGSFLQKQIYSCHMNQQFVPGYLPKGVVNLGPHKNLHTDVYNSFIQKSYLCSNCRRFIDVYRDRHGISNVP